jgi:hypothetical protein
MNFSESRAMRRDLFGGFGVLMIAALTKSPTLGVLELGR